MVSNMWEFANQHEIITLFIVWAITGAVVNIVRAIANRNKDCEHCSPEEDTEEV